MSRMLVDKERFVSPCDQPVCIKNLTDYFVIRRGRLLKVFFGLFFYFARVSFKSVLRRVFVKGAYFARLTDPGLQKCVLVKESLFFQAQVRLCGLRGIIIYRFAACN